MAYWYIQNQQLVQATLPPNGVQPLLGNAHRLLPPLISDLHRSFAMWSHIGYSPGPITAERVWFGADGALSFAFPGATTPRPLLQVGLAPDLAAWLVLLDKWMETFVVVARARSVWSVSELAAALPFLTPAFLPRKLVNQPPLNWMNVAMALAEAVADGELRGQPHDRH